MIGSGHLKYYLIKWRNLYRYSQQGWESMNSLIKSFYLKRNERRGFAGDNENRYTPKVVPFAKWIQRCLVWKSGY